MSDEQLIIFGFIGLIIIFLLHLLVLAYLVKKNDKNWFDEDFNGDNEK